MTEKTEIIRKSFGLKEQIRPQLEESYHSSLIDRIKQENFRHKAGRLTICLAEEFGFCYGVDRAIDYAYETRAKFPDRQIYITNEIIHNPQVNEKLVDMGIHFLDGSYSKGLTYDKIQKEDVVIIPAFGATVKEINSLVEKGCVMVDTTCGSVMTVWKRVESYSRDAFTSVIHGKYDHEETCATSSRALRYPEGKYLIVRDKEETQMVCDYIEGKGNREAFLTHFENAMSPKFDPDQDLQHIGCANQTTMLSSESLEIASMLQEALRRQYGEETLPKMFRHFDTICSATQDRQDAVIKLLKEDLDLMIVVGGFNSSNTGHLCEISTEYGPAFHVNDKSCIISKDLIRHKKVFSTEILETRAWLPKGDLKVGVTAGASTPNRVIEEVIERVIEIA